MNRALLKQDAKDAMKAANPHPVLTTLVFWAIQLAAQIILGIVSSKMCIRDRYEWIFYKNHMATIAIFRKNLRSHHPAEDRIHIRRHKIVPALSLNNNRRW